MDFVDSVCFMDTVSKYISIDFAEVSAGLHHKKDQQQHPDDCPTACLFLFPHYACSLFGATSQCAFPQFSRFCLFHDGLSPELDKMIALAVITCGL